MFSPGSSSEKAKKKKKKDKSKDRDALLRESKSPTGSAVPVDGRSDKLLTPWPSKPAGVAVHSHFALPFGPEDLSKNPDLLKRLVRLLQTRGSVEQWKRLVLINDHALLCAVARVVEATEPDSNLYFSCVYIAFALASLVQNTGFAVLGARFRVYTHVGLRLGMQLLATVHTLKQGVPPGSVSQAVESTQTCLQTTSLELQLLFSILDSTPRDTLRERLSLDEMTIVCDNVMSILSVRRQDFDNVAGVAAAEQGKSGSESKGQAAKQFAGSLDVLLQQVVQASVQFLLLQLDYARYDKRTAFKCLQTCDSHRNARRLGWLVAQRCLDYAARLTAVDPGSLMVLDEAVDCVSTSFLTFRFVRLAWASGYSQAFGDGDVLAIRRSLARCFTHFHDVHTRGAVAASADDQTQKEIEKAVEATNRALDGMTAALQALTALMKHTPARAWPPGYRTGRDAEMLLRELDLVVQLYSSEASEYAECVRSAEKITTRLRLHLPTLGAIASSKSQSADIDVVGDDEKHEEESKGSTLAANGTRQGPVVLLSALFADRTDAESGEDERVDDGDCDAADNAMGAEPIQTEILPMTGAATAGDAASDSLTEADDAASVALILNIVREDSNTVTPGGPLTEAMDDAAAAVAQRDELPRPDPSGKHSVKPQSGARDGSHVSAFSEGPPGGLELAGRAVGGFQGPGEVGVDVDADATPGNPAIPTAPVDTHTEASDGLPSPNPVFERADTAESAVVGGVRDYNGDPLTDEIESTGSVRGGAAEAIAQASWSSSQYSRLALQTSEDDDTQLQMASELQRLQMEQAEQRWALSNERDDSIDEDTDPNVNADVLPMTPSHGAAWQAEPQLNGSANEHKHAAMQPQSPTFAASDCTLPDEVSEWLYGQVRLDGPKAIRPLLSLLDLIPKRDEDFWLGVATHDDGIAFHTLARGLLATQTAISAVTMDDEAIVKELDISKSRRSNGAIEDEESKTHAPVTHSRAHVDEEAPVDMSWRLHMQTLFLLSSLKPAGAAHILGGIHPVADILGRHLLLEHARLAASAQRQASASRAARAAAGPVLLKDDASILATPLHQTWAEKYAHEADQFDDDLSAESPESAQLLMCLRTLSFILRECPADSLKLPSQDIIVLGLLALVDSTSYVVSRAVVNSLLFLNDLDPDQGALLPACVYHSNARLLSEAVLSLLNREQGSALEVASLNFVRHVFSRSYYSFFYTNDIKVLFDIMLRKLDDCPRGDPLLSQYLRCLSSMLLWPEYASAGAYRVTDLRDMLGQLSRNNQNDPQMRLIIAGLIGRVNSCTT